MGICVYNNISAITCKIDCYSVIYKSRELRCEFSDNSNEVREENNVPGSDKIIHSSFYFLADETGGDVIGKKRIVREKRSTGYKVDFISNAFKSIALLRYFNLYERNTGTNKETSKHRVIQSKVSYLLLLLFSYYSIAIGYRTSL